MSKCKSCGEKPQKSRAFPSAVVEINNPEQLVLLRKVVIPASMPEETNPPVIGRYKNVILQYEDTNHLYIYSSDGIPTPIEANIPQEILDRIDTLESDVDNLESDLADETEARQTGDSDLSDRIDGVVDDLADEVDARELADERLEDAIDTKQDQLTAGDNISIVDESGVLTISAVDTIYDDTQIRQDLADETLARQQADNTLQGEIDTIVASSDVKDIVGTYAELEDYDTSTLGDRDIIKVLQDETQLDQTTYYRWSTSTETFSLIGAEGPYYTKAQTNELLDEKQDELVAGENITIADESGSLVISATDTTYTFDSTPTAGSDNPVTSQGIKSYVDTHSVTFKPFPASVVTDGTTQQFMNSIRALQPTVGMAYLGTVDLSDAPDGFIQEEVEVYVYSDYVLYCIMRSTDIAPYEWWCSSYNYQGWRPVNTDTTYTAGYGLELNGTEFSVDPDIVQDTLTAGDNITIEDESGSLVISATDTTYDAFTGTDGTAAGTAGLVPAPATTDAGKVLGANGSWVTGGPNVVQTTGTSTTDVMSQNATTSMVFADPGSNTRVRIGAGADNVGQIEGVSIGKNANDGIGIGKPYVVGIGSGAKAKKEAAVAIGVASSADGVGSIALGARASATAQGEMNIGATLTSYGYNSSNYRLLTGLYDPQSAHDAATKGYVDSAVTGIESELDAKQDVLTAGDNITIADESGDLVISATDTTYTAGTGIAINNGVISATSTGPTVVQTTGTSTTDVMSQKAVTDTLFAKNNNTLIWIGPDNYQNKQSCNSPSGLVLGSGLTALNNDAYDFITVAFSGNPIPARHAINLMGNSPLAIGGISIGRYSHAKGQLSVALGTGSAVKVTTANSGNSVAVGTSAYADGTYSVALGAGAYANGAGVMDVGTSRVSNTAGYNSSAYRLLTGLYDGQSAHDAATKGQLDAAVNTIDTALDAKQDELTPGTGISITEESGALVISATGAAIATINAQDWSNLWQ